VGVVDGSRAPQRDARGFLARERLLVGGDCNRIEGIVGAKLGVIVEVTTEIQASEPLAVALTEKASERQRRLRRLRRVWPQALHDRILWPISSLRAVRRILFIVTGHALSSR